MPNPKDLSSYEFSENPYMSLLKGGSAPSGAPTGGQAIGGEGMPPQEGGQPSEMVNPNQTAGQAEAQGVQGQAMAQQQSQLEKGVNPGSTKYLTGAVQSIEKFITESDDKEAMMLARGIVSAISRLIARDQEKYMQELQ